MDIEEVSIWDVYSSPALQRGARTPPHSFSAEPSRHDRGGENAAPVAAAVRSDFGFKPL